MFEDRVISTRVRSERRIAEPLVVGSGERRSRLDLWVREHYPWRRDMEPARFERRSDGTYQVHVGWRGLELLRQGDLNKGTAFTASERRTFELEGLVPSHVATLADQVRRVHGSIVRKDDALERYIGMMALLDRNETLFYRTLLDHLEELMPVVYTPTVGDACRTYSRIFRRGRGLWITPEHRGRIAEILGHAHPQTELIVVTDNERILGLGDQGAGGMGIPVGKLALYSACAGIHPSRCLPVSLDVGTDNEELLADDLYVGYRSPRLRGPSYDSLVEEFVAAVKQRFPSALLQWEDFKKGNAIALLARYRTELPSFNDDIQGTAAVALAAVLGAGRVTGTAIGEQRIAILGAGAAGLGIARQLRDAMMRDGLDGSELRRRIAVLDSGGLITDGHALRDDYKRELAWPAELARSAGLDPSVPADLAATVRALAPTILIGTSGQGGVFTEEVVRTMASGVERPAVFPFSNPTSKSEATPADVLRWTDGRALVATGSPFAPVEIGGRVHDVSQGNNVYVFPGVGLGALVGGAREVTDSMFTVAARTLAEATSAERLATGALLPPLADLREVSRRIAIAVVHETERLGLGRGLGDDEIERAVATAMWEPDYPTMIAV